MPEALRCQVCVCVCVYGYDTIPKITVPERSWVILSVQYFSIIYQTIHLRCLSVIFFFFFPVCGFFFFLVFFYYYYFLFGYAQIVVYQPRVKNER